jgi:hypothetical protein
MLPAIGRTSAADGAALAHVYPRYRIMRKTVRSCATLLAVLASLPMSACGRHDAADSGARAVPANAAVPPATPAGSAPMGSAPMGSAPMGSAPMGSAPMGGAPMGGAPMGGAPMATADTVPRVHHSMLKGAIVGAVAGHIAGRHALAGAAAGALVQHERNKHP